jgi:hypothetical protein
VSTKVARCKCGVIREASLFLSSPEGILLYCCVDGHKHKINYVSVV